jgi:hypothetical protein
MIETTRNDSNYSNSLAIVGTCTVHIKKKKLFSMHVGMGIIIKVATPPRCAHQYLRLNKKNAKRFSAPPCPQNISSPAYLCAIAPSEISDICLEKNL